MLGQVPIGKVPRWHYLPCQVPMGKVPEVSLLALPGAQWEGPKVALLALPCRCPSRRSRDRIHNLLLPAMYEGCTREGHVGRVDRLQEQYGRRENMIVCKGNDKALSNVLQEMDGARRPNPRRNGGQS